MQNRKRLATFALNLRDVDLREPRAPHWLLIERPYPTLELLVCMYCSWQYNMILFFRMSRLFYWNNADFLLFFFRN
jgi:hypothetical protein